MRSRKESVEIYDSSKKNSDMDKYMANYIVDQSNEENPNQEFVDAMEIEKTDNLVTNADGSNN